jgi:hypothetical protein
MLFPSKITKLVYLKAYFDFIYTVFPSSIYTLSIFIRVSIILKKLIRATKDLSTTVKHIKAKESLGVTAQVTYE